MSKADIEAKVIAVVADVLVVEPEEVTASSRLINDLGAESIDFLDLVFQLEKTFSIKIPRGQLEKDARGDLSEQAFEDKGTVTAEGMQALRRYFEELPDSCFEQPIKVNEIPTLFSVSTFIRVVEKALAKQAAESEPATV